MKQSFLSRIALMTGLLTIVLIVSAFSFAPAANQDTLQECAVEALPTQSGQMPSDATCFSTASEALAFATDATQNRHLIGILYTDAGFKGHALSVYVSGPPCSTGHGYGLASMPPGWNDVVSSLKGGFYGCHYTRLFVNINFGGLSRCYHDDAKYVGDVMNDKTSSAQWWANLPPGCILG